MTTIAGFTFPSTPEEAGDWQPYMDYRSLAQGVLLVAKTRIEGSWSCYCVKSPGQNHDREMHMWQDHGTKVSEHIARAAHPQFDELPYDY